MASEQDSDGAAAPKRPQNGNARGFSKDNSKGKNVTSEKFRRQLREEAELWWTEGMIDAAFYDSLSRRYRFSEIEGEASNQFIGILLGLGAVLLGLGAITFVAANWTGWTRIVKVAILLSSFVATNTVGFYLWRGNGSSRAAASRRRWGHALLILATFILGANLGLLPQMFHQGGPVYGLLLLWGACVTLMAYGLRLTSLGVIAICLLLSGYLYSLVEVGEFALRLSWGPTSGFWLMQAMPLIVIALFLPLAYVCQSRVIFGLGALAFVVIFSTNLVWGGLWPSSWTLSFAFLCPALLWAFDRDLWQFSGMWRGSKEREKPSWQQDFVTIARVMAIALLCVNLYLFSFHFLWDSARFTQGFWASAATQFWPTLLDEIFLLGCVLIGWLQLLKQFPGFNKLQLRALNSAMVLLLIAVPVGLNLYSLLAQPLPIAATLTVNILLALLALGLLRDGLALGWRSAFWGGMVLLVLDILTRMFEYDTGLLAKAFAFMLCGIGVILAGIWFERKSRRKRLPPSVPPQSLDSAPA